MMMQIIKKERRGSSDYKWCKCFYYYSFGPYFNPLHNGFDKLKSFNEINLFKKE